MKQHHQLLVSENSGEHTTASAAMALTSGHSGFVFRMDATMNTESLSKETDCFAWPVPFP